MNYAMNLVQRALFIALGVVFPIAFHFFGAAGSIFLPMHIPVLLAGFLLGEKSGAMVGMMTPVVSSFLTGMPPLAVLPIMMVELFLYGVIGGAVYRRKKASIWLALFLAMLGGRFGAALAVFMLAPFANLPFSAIDFLLGSVVTGFPGMILQFMFIPLILKRVQFYFTQRGC